MTINTSSLLNFLKPNINESIKGKIESLSKDGKVDITTLLKDKNIQTLINSLFKDILSGLKTKSSVSDALKNSKSMFDFKNLSVDIKDILSNIKDNAKLQKQVAVLKEFLLDIKNINDKNLKSNINNSGIFLESKLLKNSPNIATDLKASLLQIQEQVNDPKIQKVLSQIEFNQLLSYTSYSNNTFLPFMWDNIEDGSVSINQSNEDNFTCSIDLNLKNYGELKAIILLEKNNNININIRIKSDILKQKIQDNLPELRQRINNIDLNLQSLNILKYNDSKTYEQKAYDSNNKLSYGIDIKA